MSSEDRTAYVEDQAEDSSSSDRADESTRRYARSSAHASPTKERPNTGKSRADKRPTPRKKESSSTSISPTESDSTARSRSERKAKEAKEARKYAEREFKDLERRRRDKRRAEEDDAERRAARAEAKAREASKALRKTRPTAPKHSQTQPIIQQHAYKRGHDDPSYYGVQQPASSGSRPRQTRPASYYAGQGSRPPITNMGWHQGQHPSTPLVGTYPPPMYGGPPPGGPPQSPTGPPAGYFDNAPMQPRGHDHLKQRFDRPARPASAMSMKTASPMSYPRDDYDEEQLRISRRPSRSKQHTDDRRKMPPPDFIPRPQSAMPQTPYRPPPAPLQRPPSRQHQKPPSAHRRSVGFADQRGGYDDSDFLGEDGLFHDMSPDPSYEQRRTALARSHRKSGTYEDFDVMPASSRGKRASMYGTGALGTGGVSLEEDKYMDALRYQDDVGGAQMPLTAETLRKASKPRPSHSSRSTRSSQSRDESEFKRSNTTGITRSSSGNNDDVTIKLSGAALVKIQGAEIECADGGEITFSSRPSGSRSGSDQASTVYQLEDSRSRVERKALPHRARAPSQSDSQSRGYPPKYAPYEPAFAVDY